MGPSQVPVQDHLWSRCAALTWEIVPQFDPWVDEIRCLKRNETYPGSGKNKCSRYYFGKWTDAWIFCGLRWWIRSQWQHHQQAMRSRKIHWLMKDESAFGKIPFDSLSHKGLKVVKRQLLRTDQDNALVLRRCFLKLWPRRPMRNFLKLARQMVEVLASTFACGLLLPLPRIHHGQQS